MRIKHPPKHNKTLYFMMSLDERQITHLICTRLCSTCSLASFLRNVLYALFTPLCLKTSFAWSCDSGAATPCHKIRCGNRRIVGMPMVRPREQKEGGWRQQHLSVFVVIRGRFSNKRKTHTHINFFNINFLARTRNPPFGPPKKSLCERTQKGTHINFFGGISGVKNGPFSSTKSLVCCFFFPP